MPHSYNPIILTPIILPKLSSHLNFPIMDYNFSEIERKWQQHWQETQTYRVIEQTESPKYYVLDMFPYPSGAGLHVGHPLGYIASDIIARYKRHRGFNVLHPMGYDSFGLPAEQYAIQTGQHPEITLILIATVSNSTALALLMIGTAKSAPAIRNTTAGLNGFSVRFSMLGLIMIPTEQNILIRSSRNSIPTDPTV